MATATQPQVQTKPEARADVTLARLYETYANSAKTAGSTIARIVEHIKDKHLSREVVLKSLLSKGLTEKSAQSETSRLMRLSDPDSDSTLQRLKSGQITVTAARREVATPQRNPAISVPERIEQRLKATMDAVARVAFKEGDGKAAWLEVVDRIAQEAWALAVEANASEDGEQSEPE